MVPVERIELPTFGLQNRCSTAELNRLTDGRDRLIGHLKEYFAYTCRFIPGGLDGKRAVKYQTCLPGLQPRNRRSPLTGDRPDAASGAIAWLPWNRDRLGRTMARRGAIRRLGTVRAARRGTHACSCGRSGILQAICPRRRWCRRARGLASPHCGAGLQGARWSTEFPVQYEWCLEASPEAIAAERDARSDSRRLHRSVDRSRLRKPAHRCSTKKGRLAAALLRCVTRSVTGRGAMRPSSPLEPGAGLTDEAVTLGIGLVIPAVVC